MHNNRLLLKTTINGEKGQSTLDWGIPDSALFGHSTNQNLCNITNAVFSGSAKFSCEKIANECESNPPNARLGYGFFKKAQQPFHLDFDTGQFCCLDNKTLLDLRTTYDEIKSNFRNDGIYITVTIKWKPYVLKFDTGYDGTIMIDTKSASRFIKEAAKQYEDSEGDFAVYPNKWVTIGNSYYNAAITVAGESESKIGVGFIKGFNWIIDFRHQKVYLKKNTISMDAQNIFPPDYRVKKLGENLIVTSKSKNVKRFPLGSTIKRFNDVAVTSDNICEIATSIENTKDWNMVLIETVSVSSTPK